MSVTVSSASTGGATVTDTVAEETPCTSVSNHSRDLEYLIFEVYRLRIEERVRFGNLISLMPPFMGKIMAEVYKKEKIGDQKEAARVFFNHLHQVNEKGKYQSFVDALRKANYPVLVKALENVDGISSNEDEHKQLINLFFDDIKETIDPELMSQELQMKEVITSEEGEQVRKTARNFSRADANLELLLKIPLRIGNWYEIFLGLLLDYQHYNLVKKIDPKFYDLKRGNTEEVLSSITTTTDESMLTSDDHIPEQSIDMQSANSAASSSDIEISSNRANPDGPAAHSVQHRRSEASANGCREILNELVELKSLFYEHTKCLQEILEKTEVIARRIDSLEHKLESTVLLTSPGQ